MVPTSTFDLQFASLEFKFNYSVRIWQLSEPENLGMGLGSGSSWDWAFFWSILQTWKNKAGYGFTVFQTWFPKIWLPHPQSPNWQAAAPVLLCSRVSNSNKKVTTSNLNWQKVKIWRVLLKSWFLMRNKMNIFSLEIFIQRKFQKIIGGEEENKTPLKSHMLMFDCYNWPKEKKNN